MADVTCGCELLLWAGGAVARCLRKATQEDMLCDECREGKGLNVIHLGYPGGHVTYPVRAGHPGLRELLLDESVGFVNVEER